MNLSVDEGRDDAANGLRSLWQETTPAGPAFSHLGAPEKADIVIVGAGYTGLAAALHLAALGADVVVLEGREPGWGASGRNGGQVIAGLKYDPPELMARYGSDLGSRMVQFVGAAPQLVFDMIRKYDISCSAVECGWIQPAHNHEMESVLRRRAESWAKEGADVEILEQKRLAEFLGSSAYKTGWLDRRGGALNPLAYARGLARAASRSGVRIYSHTAVQRLERKSDYYIVHCPAGTVRAQQVIIATNAYTGNLVDGLQKSVVPVHSFQIATDPLPQEIRQSVLPFGHCSSDSRRVLLYFRLDAEGRFLMGGVGTTREPLNQKMFRHLRDAVKEIYPQINVPFMYHWYGKVAITRDFLPHLHEPEPGLHCALGYNGRGVAMGSALGTLLARRANGEAAASLPMPSTPIKPIPFHAMRNLIVAATRTYYRVRDIRF